MLIRIIRRALQRVTNEVTRLIWMYTGWSYVAKDGGLQINMVQIQRVFIVILLSSSLIITIDTLLYLSTGISIGASIFISDLDGSPCEQSQCPVYLAERQGKYIHLPYGGQKDSVVVLTLVFTNETDHLMSYLENLCCLAYPKELVSLVILQGTDDAKNDNISLYLQQISLQDLQNSFMRIDVVPLDRLTNAWLHPNAGDVLGGEIFSRGTQFLDLLKVTEDWVLWIDLGVEEIPSDLIQRFLIAERDILVPACVARDKNSSYGNDVQSQRRRAFWKARQKEVQADQQRLERHYHAWLKKEELKPNGTEFSTVIPAPVHPSDDLVLDVVGEGECVAFVKAECYLKDLLLPSMFEKRIDFNATYGLALMAENIGTIMYGMPDLIVIHR